MFLCDGARDDRPASGAEPARRKRRGALQDLAAGKRLRDVAWRRHHPCAAVADVQEGAPVEADATDSRECPQLASGRAAKGSGEEGVRGARWSDPHVGRGVQAVSHSVEPCLEVAVRRLDRNAPEHGDRPGGRDGDRARAVRRRAKLDHREIGGGTSEAQLEPVEGVSEGLEDKRQQEQQGERERRNPGDRRRRGDQQDHGRGGEGRDAAAQQPPPRAPPWETRGTHRVTARGEDRAPQRAEHAYERRQHAAAACERHAGPGDDPLRRDREREREIAGTRLEEGRGQKFTEGKSEHARHDA